MDGLSNEALAYTGTRLSVLLALCYSSILLHGVLQSSMIQAVIIPLVKNRCGDLFDPNNYRPVALANVISRVWEVLILSRC